MPPEARSAGAQAALLFRIQCTLFCVFYTALLFTAAVFFRVRMAHIIEAMGEDKPFPIVLEVARFLHRPLGLLLAGAMPFLLIILVWVYRPNMYLLIGQVMLMATIVFFAFLPPVATEITTSAILESIFQGAREKGIIK